MVSFINQRSAHLGIFKPLYEKDINLLYTENLVAEKSSKYVV